MVHHPPSRLGIIPKPEQRKFDGGGLSNGLSMCPVEHSETKRCLTLRVGEMEDCCCSVKNACG